MLEVLSVTHRGSVGSHGVNIHDKMWIICNIHPLWVYTQSLLLCRAAWSLCCSHFTWDDGPVLLIGLKKKKNPKNLNFHCKRLPFVLALETGRKRLACLPGAPDVCSYTSSAVT